MNLREALQARADDLACDLIEGGAFESDLLTRMAWAVTTGRPATVQALIDRGADLNKRTSMGSPLEVAAAWGHLDIAARLLRAGADPHHGEPLTKAIAANHPELALLLLEHGVPPSSLETAAWLGQTQVVQQLLQRQIPIDAVQQNHPDIPLQDFTALHAAALAGRLEILELLLQAGADPHLRDGQGRHAGELATPEAQAWFQAQAVEFRPDLNRALQQAIEQAQPQQVHQLLQAGADPHQPDARRATRGFTPLMLAATHGQLEILELLLQAGAAVDATDGPEAAPNLKRFVHFAGKSALSGEPLGHTALFCAARHDQAAAVARLLQAGADPQRRDFLDESPLQWAAEAGHRQALQALLQGGAVGNDSAALLAALENGHAGCALDLLRAGTVPSQKVLIQAAYLADADLLQQILTQKPKLKTGPALAPVAYAMRKVPADQAPPGNWATIFNEHGCFKSVPQPEEKILAALEVLLQAGAPVDTVSPVGPALYVAAQQGLVQVVQRLLQAGADGQLAHQDMTPLKVAELMQRPAVVELLQQLPPPVAVSPPQPPPQKARPRPRPALKKPKFKATAQLKAALTALEQACGSPSTQPDYLAGGHEIHCRLPIDVLALQRQWLEHGCYLFHPGSPDSLAVIPTNHWRQAIALMQTNGANCDILPADVVAWLEELETTQPFELTLIGHDRLEGIFRQPLSDPKAMARKMYKFCPDLVDQGSGSLPALVEELQKIPTRLYFWWD